LTREKGDTKEFRRLVLCSFGKGRRETQKEFWWLVLGEFFLAKGEKKKRMNSTISGISIYYVPESDILVKSYDNLNLPTASTLQFQAYRYINGLNWTSESKVMTVGICLAVSSLILSVSIYF